jgi:hypothetical protein
MVSFFISTFYENQNGERQEATIYRIEVKGNKATFEKSAIVLGSSSIHTGILHEADSKIENPVFLGIMNNSALTAYRTKDRKPHPFSDESQRLRLSCETSCSAGFFKTENEARAALELPDLNFWDKRFKEGTLAVLEELRSCGAIIFDTKVANGTIDWQDPQQSRTPKAK